MGSMWFAHLWLVVTDNMSISICVSLRDIKILDKEASVGTFVLANALEQSTEFIGKLCVHMSQYLGILMSWQYSNVLPVLSLMIAPMKQAELVPRTYIWTKIAWAVCEYPWWSLWGLMAREQSSMRSSWITILMRWTFAQVCSWAWVCGWLAIGGASLLSCTRAGWLGCTDGMWAGQGWASSSLSIMACPVWGAGELDAEGMVLCVQLVESHLLIGSSLMSVSGRGVEGGGSGCWGGLFAKEDLTKWFDGL